MSSVPHVSTYVDNPSYHSLPLDNLLFLDNFLFVEEAKLTPDNYALKFNHVEASQKYFHHPKTTFTEGGKN